MLPSGCFSLSSLRVTAAETSEPRGKSLALALIVVFGTHSPVIRMPSRATVTRLVHALLRPS